MLRSNSYLWSTKVNDIGGDDASAPERGRYRSLQCWRHYSKAHNHPPKIGSNKPSFFLFEQTKFKISGLSIIRQVSNRLIEIFLWSTLNDSPHHRLRTPWRWLCLVWNLIDGLLSWVVRSYRRGSCHSHHRLKWGLRSVGLSQDRQKQCLSYRRIECF